MHVPVDLRFSRAVQNATHDCHQPRYPASLSRRPPCLFHMLQSVLPQRAILSVKGISHLLPWKRQKHAAPPQSAAHKCTYVSKGSTPPSPKPWALTSPALCQVTAPTVLRAATRLAPRGTTASLAWPSRLKPESGPPSAPDRHCRGGGEGRWRREANLHPGTQLGPRGN